MKKLPTLATIFGGLALSFSLALGGCGAEGVSDGRNDSFGGSGAKTDSEFSTCQLSEVLNFVNESNTNVSRLTRAGLASAVARKIVDHRDGQDGTRGTGDDDLYDDLDELDKVEFVGPVVLDHIVAAILKRCEVDLATRPFINEKTFEGFTGGGFNRDSVELEAAMTISGLTGQRLHAILNSPKDPLDPDSRSIFRSIAKPRLMEAFSYGYSIDEMPWDSDSHEAREGLAFLPLSIESNRYIPDEGGGERELSLGTDIMDDIYFDSFDYRLTKNEQLLRGRIRWDTADVVRRLLIAAKFGAFVDDNGLKRASKVDVRTEGQTHMNTLEHDVMTGKVPWSGSSAPLEPVKEIYTRLNEMNRLPDIGNERDVLVLDPKVHLRSTRSRYHLDLASTSDMRDFYENGRQRIRDVRDAAQAALDAGTISAALVGDVEGLIAMAGGLNSGQLIADRLGVAIADISWPNELSNPVAIDVLEKNQRTSEVIDESFHEFADLIDDLDREISGTAGLDSEQYVDMFIAWQRSETPGLMIKRTPHAFLAAWTGISEGADRDDRIVAFNTFGEAELAAGNNDFDDFEVMDQEVFEALGKHLAHATTKVDQRQIEAAGSMALGLWFEQARESYVPSSNRPFGNFMIDTMDMAEMLTREEWIGLSDNEKKIDTPLDPAKVFHTVLVNEVQIELGNEAPYIERIAEFTERLNAAGRLTAEEQKTLDGANMVLGQMSDALIYLSDIKKDKVIDRLEDGGAPNDLDWVPSDASKGTIALRRLGDMD